MHSIIIAGSRGLVNPNMIEVGMAEIDITDKIACIISGGARGVDKLGETWAKKHGIKVLKFPANWERDGKSAGYKRNLEMAKVGDILVAFWDGKSKGTQHMFEIAKHNEIFTIVFQVIGNKLRKL